MWQTSRGFEVGGPPDAHVSFCCSGSAMMQLSSLCRLWSRGSPSLNAQLAGKVASLYTEFFQVCSSFWSPSLTILSHSRCLFSPGGKSTRAHGNRLVRDSRTPQDYPGREVQEYGLVVTNPYSCIRIPHCKIFVVASSS